MRICGNCRRPARTGDLGSISPFIPNKQTNILHALINESISFRIGEAETLEASLPRNMKVSLTACGGVFGVRLCTFLGRQVIEMLWLRLLLEVSECVTDMLPASNLR